MDDRGPRTPCDERDRHHRERSSSKSPGTPTIREMEAMTLTDLFRKMESLHEEFFQRMDRMEEKQAAIARTLDAILKNQEVLLHKLYDMEKNQAARTPDTRTPTELSTLVRHIHKNLGDQLQWKVQPTDHFRTKHNEDVTATVIQAVKNVEPNWSFYQVRRACNRAFENLKCRERMAIDCGKEGVKRRKLF